MLKIYGIDNRSTALIRIPAGDGRAWLQCEFTKGRPAKGPNYKPATYASYDATEQAIIEKSPYFGRLVRLVEIYDNGPKKSDVVKTQAEPVKEAPNEPAKELAKANSKEPKVYPDVTSYEEAVAVLKSLGAKATQLVSTETIKKCATTKGVTFPNYNFD